MSAPPTPDQASSLDQLVQAVSVMRAAQRQYFRDRNNLRECKECERYVDQLLADLDAAKTPGLFAEGTRR